MLQFIKKKDMLLNESITRFFPWKNYIPTLVLFILKHEPCKKNCVVNLIFTPPVCCCCIVNLFKDFVEKYAI